MYIWRRAGACLLLLAAGLTSGCGRSSAVADDGNAAPVPGDRVCRDRNALRNPYFGDLHVHTTYSLDANVRGTRANTHDAYRFATGQRIDIPPYDDSGVAMRTAQLARPLDFTAVTDHSEFFGETQICTDPSLTGYYSAECLLYRTAPDQSFVLINALLALPGVPQADGGSKVPRLPVCGLGGANCLEEAKTVWADVQNAAAEFNDETDNCSFTSFIAYEWTASPSTNNLHRNVIFGSDVVPERPTSYLDATKPELMWAALDRDCDAAAGCSYLTIPHNSDLSGGLMFQTQDGSGNDFTRDFAMKKQQEEPLIEIYQHKGSSECNKTVGLGMQDELCGFENLPYDNLTADRFNQSLSGMPRETDQVRYGLAQGLLQEQKLGVNPFKYGFVGGTDTHIATPGNVNEATFPGHGGDGKDPKDSVTGLADFIEYSPGGLTALWAEQNTRSSLFAAMRRREAYATSGPRIVVRLFGGWDLPASQCGSDFAKLGYAKGVPMGGDLPVKPASSLAPSFAVSALQDPGAAGEPGIKLQRIQIVKGWIENGERKEQVYDVAGNANDGASVDPNTCAVSDTGFSSLCAVWQDPDFDASQSAFYYARVVQDPSCRWSAQQCAVAHVDCGNPDSVPTGYEDCCNADYPKTIQERAWTSPIWYRPDSVASSTP